MTGNQTLFRMQSRDAQHPELQPFYDKGFVAFYLGFSSFRYRKVHIQLEDGFQPCLCKKSKLSDGSQHRILFDGEGFLLARRQHGYRVSNFSIERIENPITCKRCRSWLERSFLKSTT